MPYYKPVAGLKGQCPGGEMAYTSALGADAERRGGSSPLPGTIKESALNVIILKIAMGILEDFEKKKWEEAEEIEPGIGTVKGLSLREILVDDKESRLFGQFIESRGSEELARRLAAKELGQEELEQLAMERNAFSEMRERTRRVQEKLSQSEIAAILRSSPRLMNGAQLVGADKLREILSRHFDEMAIAQPEQFNDIEYHVSARDEAAEEIVEGNKTVEKLCKDEGISLEVYRELALNRDPLAFEKFVRNNMGTIQRIFTSQSTIERKAENIDSRDRIKVLLAELESSRNKLGNALGGIVFSDERGIERLASVLRSEKESRDLSVEEAKAVRVDAKKEEADMNKEWENWKKVHADYGSDIEASRSEFAGEFSKKRKKERGFWVGLFYAMFVRNRAENLN
jgi:hypothetical protein